MICLDVVAGAGVAFGLMGLFCLCLLLIHLETLHERCEMEREAAEREAARLSITDTNRNEVAR